MEITQIILGRKGGKVSAEIITLLYNRPYNTNQIADHLGMHYNNVQYHIKILLENDIVIKKSEKYGSLIFLSDEMKENKAKFEEVLSKI